MNLNCGIVGLPNVGKSTIFSALTAQKAEIANYPFCTIEPNVGIVNVPDSRLDKLSLLIPTAKVIPATVEFVDIAGLVKGASKGEGLGNQFLSAIREVGLICHVVRCFENNDIVHVNNKIDPQSDIETINTELILKDLDSLTKIYEKEKKLSRLAKTQSPLEAYEKVLKCLEDGKKAITLTLSEKEIEAIKPLNLLTMKKVIYVCNTDEESVASGNKYTKVVQDIAKSENSECVIVSGKIENDLNELETPEEKKEMLDMLGLKESGLSDLIRRAFSTLGLRVFFTAGSDEDRAWVYRQGMSAPECAGCIHTDFQKGFIKAEVYNFSDLEKCGSVSEVKKKGLYRLEGKDYIVNDGDIIFFKFNT